MGKEKSKNLSGTNEQGMKRQLGVFSVFAICTGAAFSSGFFLLPGLAADISGPSLPLAYLAAGFLMLPAILSIAELSAAMPRSGGPYFFITRSFGSMLGLVGVTGIYFMLLLKGAFAFVGVGYYLSILWVVPIQPIAIALIVVFTLLNLLGVKQTARVEVGLVIVLLIVLSWFVISGFFQIVEQRIEIIPRFQPLFPFGLEGFVSALALVFISFGGVGQVASLAEEVNKPARSIPKGMLIALGVSTFFYLAGTAVMISLIPAEILRDDQAPAATAAGFITMLPLPVILMVVAALAAFASTGNAAILSAARYPLALSRDKLLWKRFSKLTKNGVPKQAVLLTGALSVALVLLLDVQEIAKIASAFLLFAFMALCFGVIVFRESKIEEYKPKYKSPLYPWVQIAGGLVYLWLIFESGFEAVAFILGSVILGLLWYFFGLKEKTNFSAAIFHLFGRIAKRGLKSTTPGGVNILTTGVNLGPVVEKAVFIDLEESAGFEEVVKEAAHALSDRIGGDREKIAGNLKEEVRHWISPLRHNVSVAPVLLEGIEQPEMIIIRGKINVDDHTINGLIVLVDDGESPDRLVKLLSQLEIATAHSDFPHAWETAEDVEDIKASLVQDVQTFTFSIDEKGPAAGLLGKSVNEIDLPEQSVLAVIRRDGKMIVPKAETDIENGDEVIVIAQGEAVEKLMKRFSETPEN